MEALPRYDAQEPCAKCGNPQSRISYIDRIDFEHAHLLGTLKIVCLVCGWSRYHKALDQA